MTPRKAPGRARPAKWSDTQLEDPFVDDTFRMAKACGWHYVQFVKARMPGGRWLTPFKGVAGFPDAVFARDGVVLIVEFKKNDGRISEAQAGWHAHLPPELLRVWRPRDRLRIAEELNAPRRWRRG